MNTPIWTPKHPEKTRMGQFLSFAAKAHGVTFEHYQALHQWSVTHPELFWPSLCDFFKLQFNTPAKRVLDQGNSMEEARWFEGASFNFAEKLLSRRDEHPALVCVNEENQRRVLSYASLYQQVAACAQGLKAAGVVEGSRVAGVLGNDAYAVIGMLASASLGAIWSCCSPDFGIEAIVDRLGQISPQVLFGCDRHQYMGKSFDDLSKLETICQQLPCIQHLVICPRGEDKKPVLTSGVTWDDFLKPTETLDLRPRAFAHPLYILFSSGTTGKPKCIVHGAGGTLLQHLKELGLHSNLDSEDKLLFYTTCGWMMWNWMVSGLALGSTLILYDGAAIYPDSNRLFALIEQEQVSVFGTSAKFLTTVEKRAKAPNKHHQLSSLKSILSTGSPLLPKQYDFVYQQIKEDIQLSSISGGTDIVSCFALGNPMLPIYRGELQCLGLGMAVEVFDEDGQSIKGNQGELVCTRPFPSMPVGFWQDKGHQAYHQAYFARFPKVWTHGDWAEITAHQGLIIYGRSDAVLNPGGVRIGTAEIYRQVESIPEVLESLAIGQEWQDDVRIVLFVKLREGCQLDEALRLKISQTLRHNASPRHVPAKILAVADLPRTMSGKIVEIAVRNVVHGLPVTNIQALANPEVLAYFKDRAELSE